MPVLIIYNISDLFMRSIKTRTGATALRQDSSLVVQATGGHVIYIQPWGPSALS